MKLAFYIFMLYALCGVIYYPSQYSLFSFFLIFFSTLPFLIVGTTTSDKLYKNYNNVKPILYWGVIIIGFVNLGIIANNSGAGFMDIFSFDGLKSIALKSTIIRYEEDTSANSGNPILLAFTLWLIYRIGSLEKKTKWTLKVIPFIPLLMYTLLTTEKWPTFLGILFYLTGIIASNNSKTFLNILRSKIKYGVLIILLMILSLSFRGYDGGVEESIGIIFHYLFAQYNSLGVWLLNNIYYSDWFLGKLTFIGPLSFFGIIERDAGVFSESLMIYNKESNIYTAFRYIIQDFSIIGPFIINSLFSIFYLVFINLKKFKISGVIKIFIIFCALLSTNTTPFVHNSVMLGVVLCLISDYNLSLIHI